MATESLSALTATQIFKQGKLDLAQIATQSPKMRACLELARKAAATDVTVLVFGENGTGKNLLAQAIHACSPRREGPFTEVTCTALSETLMDSELFGHEKGAFTGAQAVRRGRFELAHEGTLVLDEIGDMSQQAQAKILRAVEYRRFERVGGEVTLTSNVRIIAMTHRPLDRLVAEGKFREDLLYRLREVYIELPPLRERSEDIPALCEEFLLEMERKLNRATPRLSTAALELLKTYAWPGNLRELRAVLTRVVVLVERDRIYAEDLALLMGHGQSSTSADADESDLTLEGVEKRHILKVLKLAKGHKQRTCELLGISRPTLDKKIQEFSIDMDVFRPKATDFAK